MSQKHVYNSSEGLVLKSLGGAVALNPSLRLHAPSKTVYVHPPSPNTIVSVISGGGAGHEPAHASYTGYGMLAASVSGDIFASPSAKQISSTIRLAARSPAITLGDSTRHASKSVLVVINNYTGDRLNFGLAIEKARAEGINVSSVIVSDDVSLLHSNSTSSSVGPGPRGLAGNILICKLLGAYAERGASLDDLKALGDAAVANLASIGVGLGHCHVPGRVKDKDKASAGAIEDGECEIGLGLHNEPGVERMVMSQPEVLIREMLNKILTSRERDRSSFIEAGDETVLFVNNLGGMSQLEMGAVLDEIPLQLAQTEIPIHPTRIYLSTYMTSLNAPGFSISLLNVSNIYRSLHHHDPKITTNTGTGTDINILHLLDDPTDALSWIGVRSHWPQTPVDYILKENEQLPENFHFTPEHSRLDTNIQPNQPSPNNANHSISSSARAFWQKSDISPELITRGIINACRAILDAEGIITEYDTIVGDGDCGRTFAGGAKAILTAIEAKEILVNEMGLAEVVKKIGDVLEDCMGGTIGALFAIFFTAWSSALFSLQSPSSIPQTLQSALTTLSHHTPAKPGDRTIIDALYPFVKTLDANKGIREAAEAAREGAEGTRGMRARLGRGVYVGEYVVGEGQGEDGLGGGLPPDPGAWGVMVLVEGFVRGVEGTV